MNERDLNSLSGVLIEEETEITATELCELCSVEQTFVEELVQEGVLDPLDSPSGETRFRYISVHRTRIVMRLQNDLGVNLAGAALALELMDRIETLRRQLRANAIDPSVR
jgi:chaperone modulatory protein CbpM